MSGILIISLRKRTGWFACFRLLPLSALSLSVSCRLWSVDLAFPGHLLFYLIGWTIPFFVNNL